jgi:hypothetical protein
MRADAFPSAYSAYSGEEMRVDAFPSAYSAYSGEQMRVGVLPPHIPSPFEGGG